jgi:hypothetical protein
MVSAAAVRLHGYYFYCCQCEHVRRVLWVACGDENSRWLREEWWLTQNIRLCDCGDLRQTKHQITASRPKRVTARVKDEREREK